MPSRTLQVPQSHESKCLDSYITLLGCRPVSVTVTLLTLRARQDVAPPPGSYDPDFFQHAQKCLQPTAARSARHYIVCGAWCQIMQSAGVPTSLEPNCSRVAGAHPVTTAGARADILTVLQDHLLLSDGSVTHCCADTYVACRCHRGVSSRSACAEKGAQVCPAWAWRV